MRRAVELAGFNVEARSGILRNEFVLRTDWKHRIGMRGRASTLRAVR